MPRVDGSSWHKADSAQATAKSPLLLRVVGHLPCHGVSTGHGLAGVGQASGEETAGVQGERFGRFGLWGFDVCTAVGGRVWQGWMALMRQPMRQVCVFLTDLLAVAARFSV